MGIRPRTNNESGQAIVEAALTLPLMVFVLLGTLQLFMMMHGRILAQLAAFQAARTGSLNHGNCKRMVHAAILQVLPAIEPFAKPTGSLSSNVAGAFARYSTNNYAGRIENYGAGNTRSYTGAVVWIVRDIEGRVAGVGGNGTDQNFDQDQDPMRMEVQLIFWFPMRIPFANWVIGRAMLAHYGLQAYTAQNPLMIRQTANWTPDPAGSVNAAILGELSGRVAAGEYVFPIVTTFTMRMMTPMKDVNRLPKNCDPTPASL